MKALSDTELLELFERQAISNDDWSHTLHIRIATIYLMRNSLNSALQKIRDGIKKLNETNAIPESQFRGFHETLTIAWVKVVAGKIAQANPQSSLDLLEQHPDLLNARLLNAYYSPERLMSLEAKANFIEPDIKPLA